MQIAHRKKAFKYKPLTLLKELAICWSQALISLNYRLLLLVKNFSFQVIRQSVEAVEKEFYIFCVLDHYSHFIPAAVSAFENLQVY